MKALLKVLLVSGILSLVNFTATAQTQRPACSPPVKAYGSLHVSSVAGCPFSAVVEITNTQMLGDGSHIVTRVKALSYRDSAGRVGYQSFTVKDTDKDASEAPNMIEIYDPVAGFFYNILPQHATVYRNKVIPPAPRVGEQLPRTSAPKSTQMFGQDPRTKIVVEDLGSQQMQGVLVTGTRTTTTIHAGVAHNDHKLTVVNETWISPDLGFELLRKTVDPRSRDTEIRVTSLELSEPDPTLFQVPADYTIKNLE
jgi:hypothetical protein